MWYEISDHTHPQYNWDETQKTQKIQWLGGSLGALGVSMLLTKWGTKELLRLKSLHFKKYDSRGAYMQALVGCSLDVLVYIKIL
jgi:hypothetical protein